MCVDKYYLIYWRKRTSWIKIIDLIKWGLGYENRMEWFGNYSRSKEKYIIDKSKKKVKYGTFVIKAAKNTFY